MFIGKCIGGMVSNVLGGFKKRMGIDFVESIPLFVLI